MIVVGLLAVGAGFFFGESYIPRLPDHRGYYLVAVDDVVRAPPPPRPRKTVVVVVDGLGMAAALTMASVPILREQGQCRTTTLGALTVSRPIYAVLSTGLEADRTGARNNDETSPLSAESVWQVARLSGLEVTGASHLPWFAQLFPAAFTRYRRSEPLTDDIFAMQESLGDLSLFHPIYIDEQGHTSGAASPQYAAAVRRVDGEIRALIARLDLTQDLIVLTADHGHASYGGHGGTQPEIAQVLTCYAGLNVVRTAELGMLDVRDIAPSLSLFLGLRFPRHMRAGEDDLDRAFELIDLAKTPAYAADRRAAVAHFREENAKALQGWLGTEPGTWSRLYERERARQRTRLMIGLAVLVLLFLGVSRRSGRAWKHIGANAGFVVLLGTVAYYVHIAVRGSFDFTAVNSRASYVPAVLGIGALVGLLGAGLHLAISRSREHLLRDALGALGILLGLNVVHPLVYGWPLGFPLPPQAMLLFPFFGAILLVSSGLLTVLLAATLYSFRRA